MEITVIKLPNGSLAPYGEQAQEELAKVKSGTLMNVKATRMRNYPFHQRFFALVGVAFGIWCETVEPMEYMGQPVMPNQERFRKDMTILAGYYTTAVTLKGEVRLEAKSISFANMDEIEFEALYSQCINVILNKILRNPKYTAETLNDHVQRVLQFDRG